MLIEIFEFLADLHVDFGRISAENMLPVDFPATFRPRRG